MLTRSLVQLRLRSPSLPQSLQPPLAESQASFLLLLPQEMLHHLLSFLPLPTSGQLCLTSRPIRDLVVAWVTSPACLGRITATLATVTDSQQWLKLWLETCHQFGVFCKTATMLYSSDRRLACLVSWLPGLEQLACGGLQGPWGEMSRRAGLAAALHSLSLGWEQTEFSGVLGLLEQRYPVLGRLGRLPEYFRTGGHQNIQDQEHRQLREILRTFFWEFAPDEATQAGWLTCLLNKFSCPFNLRNRWYKYLTRHGLQSMLLFFMLGCTRHATPGASFQQSLLNKLQDTPDYSLLEDSFFTGSYTEAKHSYGDLGKAMRLVENNRPSPVQESSLYFMIEAVFEDGGWDRDNIAACLLFSSEAVVKHYLLKLARSEMVKTPLTPLRRVAETLVALIVVCDGLGNGLNQGLANILDFAFTVIPETNEEKSALINEFWREFGGSLEDDLSPEVLVQLGVHLGLRAYRGGLCSFEMGEEGGSSLGPEE